MGGFGLRNDNVTVTHNLYPTTNHQLPATNQINLDEFDRNRYNKTEEITGRKFHWEYMKNWWRAD